MTLVGAFDSIDDAMRVSLESTVKDGDEVATSRGPTLELRGAAIEIRRPRARVSRSAALHHMFSSLAETVWYLSGDESHDAITYYLPGYMDHVGTGAGAYGPRLFGAGDQVRRVIGQLRDAPSTRQAVIQLFDIEDLQGDSMDVPCTCTLQFLLRDGKLDLVTHMRSNDLVKGFNHDVFAFTFVQELVARSVGCELGAYVHMVGSLHIYTEQMATVDRYLGEGAQGPRPMPAMPAGDPWEGAEWLVRWEAASRSGSPLPPRTGIDRYWVELGLLLSGFHAARAKDTEMLTTIRSELAASAYSLFLSDRAYILEGELDDA